MTVDEIAKAFLDYFAAHGHLVAESAPLLPENDASVLFTVAGMQQFKGFYLNPDTAPSKRIASVQPCVRTVDIDEVGDNTHATIFEMLGNFSFGYQPETNGIRRDGRMAISLNDDKNKPYFKEEAITLAWLFLTEKLGIDPARIHATYFEGDDVTPADEESPKLLKEITGLPDEKIIGLGRDETFWGPTGTEGPCGPTVELHVDGTEVWNLVFNQYYFKDGQYSELESQGVDTGMGLERLAFILQNAGNIYGIDSNAAILRAVKAAAGIENEKAARIVTDHSKAAAFLLSENLEPSNKEQGYVLRRLIRRAIREGARLELRGEAYQTILEVAIHAYGERYPRLKNRQAEIIAKWQAEAAKFTATLLRGLSVLEKELTDNPNYGQLSFFLFESYGFPLEQTLEELKERGVSFNQAEVEKVFNECLLAHQNLSKAGLEQKFKGGLAGHSEQEVRYHTATHLLNAALRTVLGEHVWQKGSNINPERLRFDFSHGAKMTEEEKAEVEKLVNGWIEANLPVAKRLLKFDEAKQSGAIGVFKDKYGDEVSVYEIGQGEGTISRELCGGPHVKNTGMIGRFKLGKEEASSAGVRRIKAVVEAQNDVPFEAVY